MPIVHRLERLSDRDLAIGDRRGLDPSTVNAIQIGVADLDRPSWIRLDEMGEVDDKSRRDIKDPLKTSF